MKKVSKAKHTKENSPRVQKEDITYSILFKGSIIFINAIRIDETVIFDDSLLKALNKKDAVEFERLIDIEIMNTLNCSGLIDLGEFEL